MVHVKTGGGSGQSRAAVCWVGMGKCQAGVENIGVLRRAEDLASTYVLRPHCRNQLSSILERDGAKQSVTECDGV